MATSILVTDYSKEVIVRVPCIHYPVQFQKEQEQIKTLCNSGSEVNAMSSTYIEKLDLSTQKTNVGAQKIVSSALETFGMVIANFHVEDKGGRSRFFRKTFLVADTKFEVILGMFFLKISNADMSFGKKTPI